jgi:acyl carrier protein
MIGREQARALLAEAVNTDTGAVPDDARIGLLEQWDSLAHLRLILAIETKVGRLLDPDEIMGVESLNDVAALLNRKNPG